MNDFFAVLINDRSVWIGYTDERVEGMFEWLDGSTVSLSLAFYQCLELSFVYGALTCSSAFRCSRPRASHS